MSINLIAFRHPSMPVTDEDFARILRKECDFLGTVTEYKKSTESDPTKIEYAPSRTDCLTAVKYILSQIDKVKGIKEILFGDLVGIGSMPKLLKAWGWEPIQLASADLLPGDLIILRGASNPRLITHIGIALSSEEMFHCAKEHKGGMIEAISAVFKRYVSYDRSSPIMRSVERRPIAQRLPPPSLSLRVSPEPANFEPAHFRAYYSDSEGSSSLVKSSSPSITTSVESDFSAGLVFSPQSAPPDDSPASAAMRPLKSERLPIPTRGGFHSHVNSSFNSRRSTPTTSPNLQSSSLPADVQRSLLWGKDFSLGSLKSSISDSALSGGRSATSDSGSSAGSSRSLSPALSFKSESSGGTFSDGGEGSPMIRRETALSVLKSSNRSSTIEPSFALQAASAARQETVFGDLDL